MIADKKSIKRRRVRSVIDVPESASFGIVGEELRVADAFDMAVAKADNVASVVTFFDGCLLDRVVRQFFAVGDGNVLEFCLTHDRVFGKSAGRKIGVAERDHLRGNNDGGFLDVVGGVIDGVGRTAGQGIGCLGVVAVNRVRNPNEAGARAKRGKMFVGGATKDGVGFCRCEVWCEAVLPGLKVVWVGTPGVNGGITGVFINVHRHGEHHLAEVARADGGTGLFFGAGKLRQNNAGQNRDDRDDDEEFDQGEGLAARKNCSA